MAARVGLLLRALPLLLWGGLDAQFAERVSRELRREAEAFLEKYGYLSEQVSKAPTSMQFSDAIREFQWVSQLPVSGVLDPATLRQMTRPRCGVADTDSQAAWTERVSTLFAGRRAKMRRKKRFTKQGNKWYKQHLSYRLVNWPQHLPEPAVRGAVHAAFQLWSNVSALEFWEAPATGPADIRLTFFQGDHNDGLSNAFDGPEQPCEKELRYHHSHFHVRKLRLGGVKLLAQGHTASKWGRPGARLPAPPWRSALRPRRALVPEPPPRAQPVRGAGA
ncbi:matrix metalloproteinase-28 isoform X6 [Pteropus vampyrus]|uniref:Matrix metalloproteinase-28 isoform X6 n=1 Tax=Pteropus vampyrus TaxID=132908 RepID=A0A6P6BU11_PTEVA|nr:matrix metalloproteinase-28 isoform X6 [Pteropus vampyrus]